MMCYDVPCTLVPVSSWFRFSLASSSDHWNSRFAKKTLGDMEMLQCSGSPLHVSFWPAHPGRGVFGKLMQPQHPGTRSKDKQRRNTSHDITCHTGPYWAILSHIGPCDATGIYRCLRCSSTTAPVLYNGAHVVLGSNMLQRFNCHKQEIAEILHRNCCKQDTSQYFRNLGQKIARSLRLENFSCCPKGVTEALASSPLTPMQVTLWCPQG